MSARSELQATVEALVHKGQGKGQGKGILAADESGPTIGKRFHRRLEFASSAHGVFLRSRGRVSRLGTRPRRSLCASCPEPELAAPALRAR